MENPSNPNNIQNIIDKLRRVRAELSTGKLFTAEIKKEVKSLLKYQFDNQVDPYGNKWKKTNEGKNFDAQKNLFKSFNVEVAGNKVLIYSSLSYAIYLHRGTKHLPARPILPDPSRGLGKWGIKINQAYSRAIRKAWSASL